MLDYIMIADNTFDPLIGILQCRRSTSTVFFIVVYKRV